MLYIDHSKRVMIDKLFKSANSLDDFFDELSLFYEQFGYDDGILAYVIYKLLVRVCGNRQRWTLKANAIKVLETVKDEYFVNYVRPHERDAKKRNGDVK